MQVTAKPRRRRSSANRSQDPTLPRLGLMLLGWRPVAKTQTEERFAHPEKPNRDLIVGENGGLRVKTRYAKAEAVSDGFYAHVVATAQKAMDNFQKYL